MADPACYVISDADFAVLVGAIGGLLTIMLALCMWAATDWWRAYDRFRGWQRRRRIAAIRRRAVAHG